MKENVMLILQDAKALLKANGMINWNKAKIMRNFLKHISTYTIHHNNSMIQHQCQQASGTLRGVELTEQISM